MGELIKVKIKAYTNKKLTAVDSDYPEFEFPVNPESYSKSFKVEYEVKKAQGSQGVDGKFKSTAPEEISFDFVLDGTGTIEKYKSKELVSKQIDNFLNTVYFMKGDIHKPKFLKLNWGTHLVFDCVMTSLDINYTLFNSSGEPLRAKLKASFLNYIEQEKRVLREDKRSPDLSHVRQVIGGDKLALMTHEIYGDTSFYTQVARVNKLTSFRHLKEGQDIIFPPIKKENN